MYTGPIIFQVANLVKGNGFFLSCYAMVHMMLEKMHFLHRPARDSAVVVIVKGNQFKST
jgi:hypothetical protein